LVLGGLFVYFVFDDLRSLWARRTAPSAAAVTLEVDGLTCDNCVRKLERALSNADGVTSATVTLDPQRAIVEGSAPVADLEAAVRATGYAIK
jgi:copper chaperone CopZ